MWKLPGQHPKLHQKIINFNPSTFVLATHPVLPVLMFWSEIVLRLLFFSWQLPGCMPAMRANDSYVHVVFTLTVMWTGVQLQETTWKDTSVFCFVPFSGRTANYDLDFRVAFCVEFYIHVQLKGSTVVLWLAASLLSQKVKVLGSISGAKAFFSGVCMLSLCKELSLWWMILLSFWSFYGTVVL